MQRDVVQTYEGQDAPHPGAADQAEPCGQGSGERRQALFTALAGLLSLALRSYLGKDEIQYSYSADTRREAGVPDAPLQLRVLLSERSEAER